MKYYYDAAQKLFTNLQPDEINNNFKRNQILMFEYAPFSDHVLKKEKDNLEINDMVDISPEIVIFHFKSIF